MGYFVEGKVVYPCDPAFAKSTCEGNVLSKSLSITFRTTSLSGCDVSSCRIEGEYTVKLCCCVLCPVY